MEIVNQAGIPESYMTSFVRDTMQKAAETPLYVNLRSIVPFDMTVAFSGELAAYRLAYAYREHAQSRVKIEMATGPQFPGAFLVVIQPKK